MITKYLNNDTYEVSLVSTGKSITLTEVEIKELNTHDLHGEELEDVEDLISKIDSLNHKIKFYDSKISLIDLKLELIDSKDSLLKAIDIKSIKLTDLIEVGSKFEEIDSKIKEIDERIEEC